VQVKDYACTNHRPSVWALGNVLPSGLEENGCWSSLKLVWQKVRCKLFETTVAGSVPSGTVVAVQFPQGVHGVFKAASAGMKTVQ
jgi:hypothetical protein